VEKQLVKNLPKDTIAIAHHWLILHGRYICLARKPLCEKCPITYMCKYFEKNHHIKSVSAILETKKLIFLVKIFGL
jgi:endonuclease-3